MQFDSFDKVKADFKRADVDKKIELYVTAEGLTGEQYKELLRMFPLSELHKLEAALG